MPSSVVAKPWFKIGRAGPDGPHSPDGPRRQAEDMTADNQESQLSPLQKALVPGLYQEPAWPVPP